MITGAVAACAGLMMSSSSHHNKEQERKRLEERHRQELINAEEKRHRATLDAINETSSSYVDDDFNVDWSFEVFKHVGCNNFTEQFNDELNYKFNCFIDACKKIDINNFINIEPKRVKKTDVCALKPYKKTLDTNALDAYVMELLDKTLSTIENDLIITDEELAKAVKDSIYPRFLLEGRRYAGFEHSSLGIVWSL